MQSPEIFNYICYVLYFNYAFTVVKWEKLDATWIKKKDDEHNSIYKAHVFSFKWHPIGSIHVTLLGKK